MSAPIDLAALRDLLFADVFCEGHLPEPGIDADEQRTKYCDGSCRHLPSQRNPHATMFAAITAMRERSRHGNNWKPTVEELHRTFHFVVCSWLQEQGADVVGR